MRLRIGLVISVVWFILFIGLVIGLRSEDEAASESFSAILLLGVLPLVIGWGIYWIRQAALSRSVGQGKGDNLKQWYYTQSGQRYGPVPEPDFIKLFETALVSPDTLVWSEGLEAWTPARNVEGLVPLAHNPPPPSPANAEASAANQADQARGNIKVEEDHFIAIRADRKEKRIYLITLFIALMISGIISAVFFGTDMHGNKLASVKKKELEANIAKLSDEFNKKLPMKIDKDTVLQSTSANGSELSFNYMFPNYKSTDLDESTIRNSVEANIIASACSNKASSGALKLGAILNYKYIGNDNIEITTIKITKDMCN
jgi:hypothetical protein